MNDDMLETILSIGACIIISIVLIFVFIILPGFCIIQLIPISENITEKNYTILSLQDNTETSGKFIFGSGYIDNNLYYSMYILNDDISIRNFRIMADNTIIYQDTDNPYLSELTTVYYSLLSLPTLKESKSYILHINNDTIFRDYKLNGL